MKKKIITIVIIIVALILLFPIPFRLKDGGSIEFRALLYTITKYHKLSENPNQMYIDGIGIEILGMEIYNSTKNQENPTNGTEEIDSKGKVIIAHDKITNIYLLDNFLDNTDKYNKNKASDKIEIITYTIEGDEISTTLEYNKEKDEFIITRDNTKDEFASEEDRKIETKTYSNSTYNLVKKMEDDYIHLVLEEDETKDRETEIDICVYRKDLEKNKDIAFFAKVIESNAKYIIVEPVEGSKELKSSDKISIELGDNNDAIYPVGTNVKITYDGTIKESYPAKINATKIEIKSTDDFELIFNGRKDLGIKTIISKDETDSYSYSIYSYGGDVKIKIDNTEYDLREALLNNKITMEEIIAKANNDQPNAISYDDGGSMEYHYENYTILKYHTLDGNRDVYIGVPYMTINNIEQ